MTDRAREVIRETLARQHSALISDCTDAILAALEAEGLAVQSADEVEARIAEAVAWERERCARIADESAKRNFIDTQMRCVFTAENIATAIRGGNHDG